MKYLSLIRTGSANKLHGCMAENYPDSKSVPFMYKMSETLEHTAFDMLYTTLGAKPEAIICFQYFDETIDKTLRDDFIDKAGKISKLVYYLHDTPQEIEVPFMKRFDRVYIANLESAQFLRQLGVAAEFLPMGCFEKAHIELTPFNKDIRLIPAICVYTQWLQHPADRLNRMECIRRLLANEIPVALYCPEKVRKELCEDSENAKLTYGGFVNPYALHQLPHYRVFFNGVSHAGELALNIRFCEVLGIGALQLFPKCQHFWSFCEAFYDEIPHPGFSPFILFDGVEDLVEKARTILKETHGQLMERRRRAALYRQKWTLSRMARVLVGDEENPARRLKSEAPSQPGRSGESS